jgi:hypothetical protein
MVHSTARAQPRLARNGTSGEVTTADRFRRGRRGGRPRHDPGLFAKDVKVFGPVVPEPVHGVRDAGAVVWAALSRFDDIRYVGQLGGRIQKEDGGAGVETRREAGLLCPPGHHSLGSAAVAAVMADGLAPPRCGMRGAS